MSRHLTLCAALGLTVLLTACSAPEEPEPSESPDATPSATEPSVTPTGGTASETADTTMCENPDDRFSVRYPADWHVNDPEPGGHCLVFHPEPFELRPRTEIPAGLAIVTRVEPVAMERMSAADYGSEELSRRETTVAGLPAVAVEARATQDAPLQEPGTLSYRYLVRLGPERTLVARTTDRGDVPYEEKRQVLDDMVATLSFSDPEA